ncbi:MAG: hypothetical protein PF551_08240 [Candidatus Marinimicrobia bacterium]|jgi:hypothetical protein|nr:hypothetical protein [Candidatus Neomarinimicrobiota bacterium]
MKKTNSNNKMINKDKSVLCNISKKFNVKNIIFISILLIYSLSFFSCFEGDDNYEGIIYPLSIGNTWDYTLNWNMYSYSDTACYPHQYEDTSTYSSDISVTVTQKVLLKDSFETFEVVGIENSTMGMNTVKRYYKNNNDGLYIYAYMSGGPIILPKKQSGNSIVFKGLKFNDFRQLSDFVQQAMPHLSILSDSIYYEEPPLKALQYPIEIGDQWTYREENDDTWRMDKKVIDRKDVELSIGTFECYEIKYIYDIDHDGKWDDDIWISDLISKKGLIQRTITILGIRNITASGDSTDRYFDSIDTYTLNDLNVEL